MAEADPVPELEANENIEMNVQTQNAVTGIIEDILDNILHNLHVKDLLTCRLVTKLWKFYASRQLRTKIRTIKLIRDSNNKNLIKFVSDTKNRDRNSLLPYQKYHIDISYKITQGQSYRYNFFKMITQENCSKLKIDFVHRPNTSQQAMEAANMRNGYMSFNHLDKLQFNITFYDNFQSEQINMQELLQHSVGIKKLNISMTSYLSKNMQYPIVSEILTTITNPSNNFNCLNTLGIDYSYLTTAHLNILTNRNHNYPIQKIALGTFDLKPDPQISSPLDGLKAFLNSQSETLKHLRIKCNKEFFWDSDSEAEAEQEQEEDRDRDEQEHDNNIEAPRRPRYYPLRMNFPRMKNLLSLEFMGEHLIQMKWAWRLDQNSFHENFPKLKKFSMINFEYRVGDPLNTCMPQLRNRAFNSVEDVRLPDPKNQCDPILLHQMLSLFPQLKCLEMRYNKASVELIFVSVPTLEKLLIHLNDELVHLDEILTGVPGLRHQVVPSDEAETYNLEAGRTHPGILSLTNLKELSLTTEDYFVRITDVTAYQIFLKMKHFCRLTINAYPWEDSTKWFFSPNCMERLKEKVHLTLNVHSKSRHEKLFA